MTSKEELYLKAKRCYEILYGQCCGTYAMINDTEYDELIELLEELMYELEEKGGASA